MNADLQSRLEIILAEPVKSTTAVSGGCIADSRKLELNSGKLFFLKWHGGEITTCLIQRNRALKS